MSKTERVIFWGILVTLFIAFIMWFMPGNTRTLVEAEKVCLYFKPAMAWWVQKRCL